MHKRFSLLHLVASALTAFALLGAQPVAAQVPAVSPEGLKLVPSTKVQVLYLRDGADFSGYDKFAILECYVAFRKNWKRDQNDGLRLRVSDSDMLRIKTDLAQQFRTVFVRELTAKGEKQVTAVGKGVLILRPSLINLDVFAPDTMTAGRQFTVKAGQATLVLEIFDSISSELLARVIDSQTAGADFAVERSRMNNRADAELVLKKWAGQLGDALVQARSNAPAAPAPAATASKAKS
jgi:hypothetical protein